MYFSGTTSGVFVCGQRNLLHGGARCLPPLELTLGCHCPAAGCRREGGEEAYRQWRELERLMQPLQARSRLLPPLSCSRRLPCSDRRALDVPMYSKPADAQCACFLRTSLRTILVVLQEGAAMLPAAALRADPGIALTAGRFGPGLLKAGLVAGQLTAPFSGTRQEERAQLQMRQGRMCRRWRSTCLRCQGVECCARRRCLTPLLQH